nr:T9SS type A sorting domain-containing protein [Chitinophagaceae bacterium]
SASGTGLCATLVGSNGLVIANTPIDANGYYEFLNVAGNATYNVYLSTVCGTIGSQASTPVLPGGWINTSEDCCDKTGLDGNTNGILVIEVTNASKVNADFGIATITQLPITLKQFTVSEFQCHGVLNWITSSEENTSHVEIYRKDNPQGNFVKVGQVKAAGNSNVDKYYTFLDEKISSQENPYQYYLKFVDIDDQFSTSNIATLKLNCNDDVAVVHVFPNPATDKLNVLFYSEINNVSYEFDIVDVTGRKIMSNSSIVNKGGTQINFEITNLASGQYFVRYHNIDDNTSGNIKFIKN